jgi:hypothetical protein
MEMKPKRIPLGHNPLSDFLTRMGDKRACVDCNVIPGEFMVSQHKLVVADFRFLV